MPLIASLSMALLASAPVQAPLVLSRGGAGDASFRYWAVEDTFLDSKTPDANYGRDALLTAGPGKTILIRFGDLGRMVGPNRRIAEARIVFRREIGTDPKLKGAYRVIQSWGEGPGRRGLLARLESRNAEPKPYGPTFAATWRHRHSGADGAAGWQAAGATGERDARPIVGATVSDGPEETAVEGLGSAFEEMRSHPLDNHGIALQFATAVDFASSDALVGKPRLELRLEDLPKRTGADLEVTSIECRDPYPKDGTDVEWMARVRNVGDQPAPSFRFEWLEDGKTIGAGDVSQRLAPGESIEQSIALRMKRVPGDARLDPLRFSIVAATPDASSENDALEVARSGVPVPAPSAGAGADAEAAKRGYASFAAYLQDAVRFWNETVLAHSRFSFARDGSNERVRLALSRPEPFAGDPFDLRALLRHWSVAIGLRDLSVEEAAASRNPITVEGAAVTRSSPGLHLGLMGGGDTRDEGEYLPQLPIPTEPWPSELVDQTPMPPTDLYSATDVARLEALIGTDPQVRKSLPVEWPKTVLVKFLNAGGAALANTDIDALTPDASGRYSKAFTFRTGPQGTSTLRPPGDGPPPPLYLFRAQQGEIVEYGWLKASQVLDAARRASSTAAILDVRIPVPALPIDTAQNLALNKIATDSADSLPARLASLVDDDPSTVLEVPPGVQWIEIDLGRDRPIGEVRILVEGEAVWPEFDVRAHQTGQTPSEAVRDAAERHGQWTLANRYDPVPQQPRVRALVYRGPEFKARYIRIVPLTSDGPVRLAGVRVSPFKMEVRP